MPGHEGGALINAHSSVLRKKHEGDELSLPPPREDTARKRPSAKQEEASHQTLDLPAV